MPARTHNFDIDILDETDLDEEAFNTFGPNEAEALAKDIAERMFKDSLGPGMYYKLLDASPNFRPLPKYRNVSVSAVVFGSAENLATYSV